jgi:hypothetical protein
MMMARRGFPERIASAANALAGVMVWAPAPEPKLAAVRATRRTIAGGAARR